MTGRQRARWWRQVDGEPVDGAGHQRRPEPLWRARTAPSHRFQPCPSGWTSISTAVKSVSGTSVAAHSSARTGPVNSSGSIRAAEVYTNTSARRPRSS